MGYSIHEKLRFSWEWLNAIIDKRSDVFDPINIEYTTLCRQLKNNISIKRALTSEALEKVTLAYISYMGIAVILLGWQATI